MNDTSDQVSRVAENAYLRLISRLAMVLFGVIGSVGLPLVVSVWNKSVAQIEALSDKFHTEELAIVKLEATVAGLNDTLKLLSVDPYHGSDAVRDFRLRDLKDQEQDRRLEKLERDKT